MLRRNIVGLVICIAVLGIATLSFAGVPELANCSATTVAGEQVCVYVLPDGQGNLMTEARALTTPSQDFVDATITVTLLDAGMNPVFAYPFEDMWLETTGGVNPLDPALSEHLVACPNGTIADGSTDINGQATFTGPFYAGGNSKDGFFTQVLVNGGSLPAASDLDILFNSADISGDGVVNLTDLGPFSADYAVYNFRSDFFYDGVVNLSDLVFFSAAINIVQCP